MLVLDLQLTCVTLPEQFDGLSLIYHTAARGNILAKYAVCAVPAGCGCSAAGCSVSGLGRATKRKPAWSCSAPSAQMSI